MSFCKILISLITSVEFMTTKKCNLENLSFLLNQMEALEKDRFAKALADDFVVAKLDDIENLSQQVDSNDTPEFAALLADLDDKAKFVNLDCLINTMTAITDDQFANRLKENFVVFKLDDLAEEGSLQEEDADSMDCIDADLARLSTNTLKSLLAYIEEIEAGRNQNNSDDTEVLSELPKIRSS